MKIHVVCQYQHIFVKKVTNGENTFVINAGRRKKIKNCGTFFLRVQKSKRQIFDDENTPRTKKTPKLLGLKKK